MRIPIDTVLLVIDMQERHRRIPSGGRATIPTPSMRIAALIADWREAAMPIVHVRHNSVEPALALSPGLPRHAFKPEAMPLPGETVVGKSTGSAFVGTELEALLTQGRAHHPGDLWRAHAQFGRDDRAACRMPGLSGLRAAATPAGPWTATDLGRAASGRPRPCTRSSLAEPARRVCDGVDTRASQSIGAPP